MSAYWVAHVNVHNEEGYNEYLDTAGACVRKFGGSFLARGGRHITLEGQDHPRNVVAEFPSVEAAVACYQSDEYQSVVGLAKASADRMLCIVDGS